MPSISVIVHTASPDDFLAGQGLASYFEALTDNLRFQTHQDFELVYVDTYHAANEARFRRAAHPLPFVVKHVPVHPAHRYWYDRGYCYISAAKNTGILYADGRLCVSIDDAEFMPPHLLARYWHHFSSSGEQGLMHALHKRLRSIDRRDDGSPAVPVTGDEYVNDHRWDRLKGVSELRHSYGTWLFAGTSFGLEDALRINGFNERMDGCKSLEDCDFGNRLHMIGRTFRLDRDGYLCILDHPSYATDINTSWAEPTQDTQETPLAVRPGRPIRNLIAVENYGLCQCATTLLDPVANRNALTPQHMDIIRRETIKYRHFDPMAPENAENLAVWLGTPTFDLRAERDALRDSDDWSW